MKKYRLVFVLSILFLGVIKLTASEYEQVRKAPRAHVPVWQSFALSEVELTDSYFKKAMDLHKGYLLSLDVDRLIHTYAVVSVCRGKEIITEDGRSMVDVPMVIICLLVP